MFNSASGESVLLGSTIRSYKLVLTLQACSLSACRVVCAQRPSRRPLVSSSRNIIAASHSTLIQTSEYVKRLLSSSPRGCATRLQDSPRCAAAEQSRGTSQLPSFRAGQLTAAAWSDGKQQRQQQTFAASTGVLFAENVAAAPTQSERASRAEFVNYRVGGFQSASGVDPQQLIGTAQHGKQASSSTALHVVCSQHLMKRIQRGPVRGISLKLQVRTAAGVITGT